MTKKRWLAGLLSLTILMPPLSVSAADEGATGDADGLAFYKAKEYTMANLALTNLGEDPLLPESKMTFDDAKKFFQDMAKNSPKEFNTYLSSVMTAYKLPQEVNVRGSGSQPLNRDIFLNRLALVYGTGPKDVPDNEYGGNGQYRYLGYTADGSKYFNIDFPADQVDTFDVSARNWIIRPWENPEDIKNSFKPMKTTYMDTNIYSKATQTKWLNQIQDKYVESGQVTNKSGTARGNFDPSWPGSKLVDYAVIQQPPSEFGPGQVTMWHRGSSSDWYDSFLLNPYKNYEALLIQYWDDLAVSARWYQQPNGTEWPNEGNAQPPETPVTLYANVTADMPRVNDEAAADLADLMKDQNRNLQYEVLNDTVVVAAKVYFLDEDLDTIGVKPVSLSDGKTVSASINWAFPEKTQKVYAVIVPDTDKSPNFLEYYLGNNAMEMTINVEGEELPPETPEDDPNLPGYSDNVPLDNIILSNLVPTPGNGGKKPGEQINYNALTTLEMPTKYYTVRFNDGNKLVIPAYATVAKELNRIGAWQYVDVTSQGTVKAEKKITVREMVHNGCSRPYTDKDGKRKRKEYDCMKNVTKDNPNYTKAKNAVADLQDDWKYVTVTARVQGKDCTFNLDRQDGSSTLSKDKCIVVGEMPDTDSLVKGVVSGKNPAGNSLSFKETNMVDNWNEVMMYPILPQDPGPGSTPDVTVTNLDPNGKGKNGGKNTEANPAKYGQEVKVTLSSSAALEAAGTANGYPVLRMYSEYAGTQYTQGACTGDGCSSKTFPNSDNSSFTGNTPSNAHYSIGTAGNKTWSGDFNNTAKDGSSIKYLYNVGRKEKTTDGITYFVYTKFYANSSDSTDPDGNVMPKKTAEVLSEWQTITDRHWTVDIVARPGKDAIGYWTQYGTIPPIKGSTPTPISEGGKIQSVSLDFNYAQRDGKGMKTESGAAKVNMFGTLVTSVGTGSGK